MSRPFGAAPQEEGRLGLLRTFAGALRELFVPRFPDTIAGPEPPSDLDRTP